MSAFDVVTATAESPFCGIGEEGYERIPRSGG